MWFDVDRAVTTGVALWDIMLDIVGYFGRIGL